MKEFSTAELASQVGLKLTDVRQKCISHEMVYICKLDGKVMRITEARKILEKLTTDQKTKEKT